MAVLPLVLFLYLVQVTERTQLFFLGKLHAFAIPQKEEYIVKKSPRAPDVSVEDCIALNTSDRIFRPRAFAQFMVIPHSVPRAFLKGAAQTLAFETQKQLVTSNSKVSFDTGRFHGIGELAYLLLRTRTLGSEVHHTKEFSLVSERAE